MNKLMKHTMTVLSVGVASVLGVGIYFHNNPYPDAVTSPEQSYMPESRQAHTFAWRYLNGNRTEDILIPLLMGEGTNGTEHLKPELLELPLLREERMKRFQSIVDAHACREGGCSMTSSLGNNRVCQVSANTVYEGNASIPKPLVLRHELEHCRLDFMRVQSPEIDDLFAVEGDKTYETNLKESYADLASLLTFKDIQMMKATIETRQYWLDDHGDINHYTIWVLNSAIEDHQKTGAWPENPVSYSLNKIADYRNHIDENNLQDAFKPTGKLKDHEHTH